MDSFAVPGLGIWLISIVGGVAVGVQKGQDVSGLIWPLFFGPLGFIVVLCLPNLKKRAQDLAQHNLLAQQVEIQRQQLEEMRRMREAPEPIVELQADKIKIAKGGKEWGDFSLKAVKEMLDSGELTLDDYFFSSEADDWITLDQLPEIS